MVKSIFRSNDDENETHRSTTTAIPEAIATAIPQAFTMVIERIKAAVSGRVKEE